MMLLMIVLKKLTLRITTTVPVGIASAGKILGILWFYVELYT